VQRILIIQTAFIGDVILATPLISEMKRLFPQAEIDVLVKKGNGPLLENDPHVHRLFQFDKKAGKVKEILRLRKEFRKRRYDLAVNLHRFGSSGILTLLSGAGKTYGFKKNPFSLFFTKRFEHQIGDGTHEVERNLSLISEFGANSMARPVLFPGKVAEDVVSVYKDEPYFCFAPSSVWFTKQLPEEKWVELLKLRSAKGKLYLLGAPEDIELCQRIIDKSGVSNAVNLAGKLSLLQSAALIRDAKRTYVNDSGPLHLASAMNAPVTAFFCSTTPEFGFGPLSDDSQIIESTEKPDCKPCGLHGYSTCPKGHFDCGVQINVSQANS
jgi:lipopolysaccharide heptosyltransferase II